MSDKNLKEILKEYKDLWKDGNRPTDEEKIRASRAIDEFWEDNSIDVGDIGNYYGGLSVVESDGSYFWAIENYDGWSPEEITKELYDSLIKFQTE